MSTRRINIFISHAWKYSEHYRILAEWIFEQDWREGAASLDFHNFSVPKDDPIHDADNDEQLRVVIFNQIAHSHVIVIPTGMYTHYSRWIQKEIDGAKLHQKPILAVNPWGQQRAASVVQKAANKTVGWNRQTLIDAIWELHSS